MIIIPANPTPTPIPALAPVESVLDCDDRCFEEEGDEVVFVGAGDVVVEEELMLLLLLEVVEVAVERGAGEDEAGWLVKTLGEGSENNVLLVQQSNWPRLSTLLWQQKLVRASLHAQM